MKCSAGRLSLPGVYGRVGVGRSRLQVAFWTASAVQILLVAGAAAQTPTVQPGVIEKEFAAPRNPQSTGGPAIAEPLLPGAPEGAENSRFILTAIDFVGGDVIPEAELQAFAAPLIGAEVSLADVYAISVAVTRAYAERGLPLSVAIVPAQDIVNGRVQIVIAEGFISSIEIVGDPGSALPALERLGEKLKRVRPLSGAALERYLLLANDLPGLKVSGVFDRDSSPGGDGEPGGVKLVLKVERQTLDAAVSINNRGSRALGRERGTLSLTENGALFGRESLGFDVVQTFDGSELTYVQARGALVLNSEGTRLALSGTHADSEPGVAALSALDFASEGWTASVELSHPLIRSRSKNLRLIGAFDAKDLSSRFGAIDNTDDKVRVLRAGAVFDFIDGSGGTTQVSGFINKGLAIFGATEESDLNKSRADASGSFVSVVGDVSRRQPLAGVVDLFLAAGGQLASRQLLASEECGYGGGAFGRGFDNYEIAGDQCAYGLAEVRANFSQSSNFRTQPYLFYDVGVVRQRGALLPGEDRQQTGQSVGAGVRFSIGDHVSASVEYAQPLTRPVGLEGDDDGRVFFSVSLAR